MVCAYTYGATWRGGWWTRHYFGKVVKISKYPSKTGEVVMEVLKIVTIFGSAQVILVVLLGWLSKVWLNRIQELDRRKTAEILESLRNNLTKEREEHLEEIKQQYSLLLEQTSQRHQLRMAALDRRLEAHQTAYTLWWELRGAVHHEEKLNKLVIECQDWWVKNCLYLDAEVRQSFRAAYFAASTHKDFLRSSFDSNTVRENWKTITDTGDAIVKAVALPRLGEDEYKPVNPSEIESG
jgi:hypothetical protein